MNRPVGRPSAYKKQFAKQAVKLCELGATDAELADFFEVSITTIKNWQAQYPEFLAALKSGKQFADDRVERSLYQRAIGYSYDAVKIFNADGVALEVPYREHSPPDTTACIFWLKNRRKDEWRDKIDHSLSGPDGKPIQHEMVTSSADDAKRKLVSILAEAEGAGVAGEPHD